MDLSFILNELGEERENYFNAVSPPVLQTSNFCFNSVQAMRDGLQDEMGTPFYTRGNNPTVGILRKKIAALEGTEDALIFGSGSAAVAAAVMANVSAGDHVICVQKPYSWTFKLLDKMLARFGVSTTFIDGRELHNYEAAVQENTRLIMLESPNSLTFELQPLREVADFAKSRNIITVIDNSYCTALNQRPADLGIDLMVHSATKYYCGHSDVVAGALCGSAEMVKKVFEGPYMTLGGIISPHDAWLMLRGLRTLPLRLDQATDTAEKLVAFLETHPKVEKVYYPFSHSFEQYELAKRQMRRGSGLFTIQVKAANLAEMDRFCNALKRFLLACSWGGHESLAFPIAALHGSENYSTTTLPWNMVRFSAGLEPAEVLLADLEQALEVVSG